MKKAITPELPASQIVTKPRQTRKHSVATLSPSWLLPVSTRWSLRRTLLRPNLASFVLFLTVSFLAPVETRSQTDGWKQDTFGTVLFLDSDLGLDKVGIGSTTPDARLGVFGGFTDNADESLMRVRHLLTGPFQFPGPPDRNVFVVEQLRTEPPLSSFSTLLSVRTSGRTGIGTDAPSDRLHVLGAIRSELGNSWLRLSPQPRNMGLLWASAALGPPEHRRLRFSFIDPTGSGGSKEVVTLFPDGRVGIGTSLPTHLLSVSGTSGFSDTVFLQDMGASSATIDLRSETGDWSQIFSENYGANRNRLVLRTGDDGDNDYTVFRNTHHNEGDKDVLAVHRNRVTIAGKVGIGTTSPTESLTVNGDAGIASTLWLRDEGTNSATIDLRSEAGDWSQIFSENYGVNRNRLVIRTGNDGDNDYAVFRNMHYNDGDKDVLEIRREHIAINADVALGTLAKPTARLDVDGNVKIAGSASISALQGNGIRMVVAKPTGEITTQAIPPSGGDNLGNHSAGQTLYMNNHDILQAANVHVNNVQFKDGSMQSTASRWNALGFGGDQYTNGRVGIGTFPSVFDLEVSGNAGKPGGGTWADTSDLRLKRDLGRLDGGEALRKLLELEGIAFEWVNPEVHPSGRQVGLGAQTVERVFPGWVQEVPALAEDRELLPAGTRVKAISFPHEFNAYLVEALRELQRQIESEKAKVQALRAVVCFDHPSADLCQ